MLQVQSLTYYYPDSNHPAVRDLSFTLEQGQVLLVAGATGAGKSTLCYALAGFVPHFFNGEIEGDVTLQGRSMRAATLGEWVKDVGLVLQNPFNQISGARMTVFEEVAFGLENLGVPRAEMGERVREVLAQLEIESLAERSPYALSGGQQQRVAIASVLAMRPDLLVLDEPTAQLDPEATGEVFKVIRGLAERGTMVVLATHQLAEVTPFVTHVLLLHEGKGVAFGAAAEILRDTSMARYGIEPPLNISLGAAVGKSLALPNTTEVAEPSPAAPLRPDYYPFVLAPSTLEPVTAMPVTMDGVSFAYPGGVQALRNVTLSFAPGNITALIGANGAGKSTLARTLNGLLRPQSGAIHIGDWDAATRKTHELARRVGYLFQNPDDQLFKATVREEVAFAPQNFYHETEGETAVARRVERALALTGLNDAADSHPYDLHAVQRRWVALASVLAGGAPVLILDEPTSGFDLADKGRLASLCIGLRDVGYTLILVSHDLQLVMELADTVVMLEAGQVAAQGSPRDLVADDGQLSRLNGILPPVAQLARSLGLPAGVVRANEFVAAYRATL